MLASLASAAVAGGVNNMLSEFHANKAHKRQIELMEKQNALNNANNVSAYLQQVHGMKMAGLNPASLEGGTNPNVSAAVSQGAAAKGENVEVDPMQLMLHAQIENLNAQTAKVEQETKNLESEKANTEQDTALKLAQTLKSGSEKEKIDEETTQISNLNREYGAENDLLVDIGASWADKMKASEWYNKLAPNTKETIDKIADGSIPLSIGGMRALYKSIEMQSSLSDSDHKLVDNAFKNAIIESQFNNPKVMEAFEKMPEKTFEKVKTEIIKLGNESDVAQWTAKTLKEKLESFEHSDLGYIRETQGVLSKDYVFSFVENLATTILALIAAFKTGRASAVSNKVSDNVSHSKSTPPIYDAHGNEAIPSKTYTHSESGVHSFRF